jgi:Fe-S oxidoreductase
VEPTRQEFLHISAPEKVLFYTLIYTSLAYMAWQIAGRARLWLRGRPSGPVETGWRYWVPTKARLSRWLTNIWTYVLLQKKVRSSRPRSGAPMHLLTFYGFLSLTVATTLLAINQYSPYKFHRGNFYLIYESTFDFLGLFLVVGVGWALGRRGLALRHDLGPAALRSGDEREAAKQAYQRRRWPVSQSLSDWLALGLIFVIGVTGYWLEACRISNVPHSFDTVSFVGYAWAKLQGPVSDNFYHFVWWFHAAWVIVFFAVLPKMRIRHILLAVASTAGKPDRPAGHLRTISMEEVEQTEQVGVKLARDYSRWHLLSLDACMECGRCTEVCPAWKVGKVLNPKQIVQDIRDALMSGEEVAAVVNPEALWACTTCHACVEACPVLIRHVDLIVESRRNLVSEGALSGPAATMLRQTASTNHAWGQPAANREDWMRGLEIPLCRDGVEFDYLFWVGCAGATDPGAVKTTKAVAMLLKKAGVRFACLGREEACTGDPARRLGEEFLFQEKAGANASTFARYGVKKVVTACPHCFNTLRSEYGEFGASLEVFHHTQLLQSLVRKGDLLAARAPATEVVLHDPCYLARVNEESEAPRALVEGMTLPPRQGKKTLCCGAGGGRMWMEEPASERPGNRRAEELLDTGAKTVAVACPFCRIMLGDSLRQVRPAEEVRLVDLAELMQEANSAPLEPAAGG